MLNDTLDYAHLRALAAVLRTGSFDAAAAALGVTPSAVSQRVKALEERMGTVLVVRGQPCTATEAGQRLFRHAEEVALLETGLARDLGGAETTRPTLRIAVNADSLATWFLPALAEAGDALFEVIIDDQDHSADLLRRGEVVAAVTAHGAPVQGCDTAPLGALRYIATASPAFRDRWFGDGLTAEALIRAPVLTFNEKDRLQRDWAAGIAGRALRCPLHLLPSSTAFVEAALMGLGWGMNPEPLVAGHLKAGRLVALDPGRPLDTPLYWQSSRIGRGALAPLTRAVRRAARHTLRQTG